MNNFSLQEIIEDFDICDVYFNFSNEFELFLSEVCFLIDNALCERIDMLKDCVLYTIESKKYNPGSVYDFYFEVEDEFDNFHLRCIDEQKMIINKSLKQLKEWLDEKVDEFEIPIVLEKSYKEAFEDRFLKFLSFYKFVKIYNGLKNKYLSFFEFFQINQLKEEKNDETTC